MRKVLLLCGMILLGVSNVSAQEQDEFYGLGNRIGVGVGIGTEGIGIDAATCLTKYVSVRLGVDFIPSATFKTDVDVNEQVGSGQPYSGKMEAKADLGRTMVSVKFDCYPFPNSSSFFVTGGFSFGGSKMLKITGHSDELASLVQQGKDLGIDIGKYQIPVDENGNVEGGVKVNGFRPYLGIGFGRLIPKGRVGFRFELGAQFHGKIKVYANGLGNLDEILNEAGGDDISKLIDNFTVYPVLKLSIRGRIL